MTTERPYLEDAYLREFAAQVTGSADGWSALSRTAFHPGGGFDNRGKNNKRFYWELGPPAG